MADKVLSKDALLQTAEQRKQEYVEVPGMGGGVHIRELSGAEMDAYQASLMKQENGEFKQDFTNSTAKLVARCAVNKGGEPMFDPNKEIDDVGSLPSSVLQPLAEAARRINGMTNAEQEDMEGNSDTASGGSSSA